MQDNPKASYRLGEASLRLGRFDDSVKHLKKAQQGLTDQRGTGY